MSDQFDDSEITQVTRIPADLASGEKQGTLTVLVGTRMGAAYALTSAATLIGRNPRAHVPLEDDGISRSQARILRRGTSYEIEDLSSTNGTYVDGVQVRGSLSLHDGARIQVGNTLLRFALQDQIEWEAVKRVYEASVRDGLTGTFNRRYFEERLISEFAFAARHGTPLCVLLIDLDHFKRINDHHGHQAGDQVLRVIGGQLRAGLRTEDVLARYGGEEFAVLARGISPGGARMLADRLCALSERARIPWSGDELSVTVSVGLAHNHSGAAASDPQRLVAAADKALYAAKAAGRNRVELASSPGRYTVVRPAGGVEAASLRPRPWDAATDPRENGGERIGDELRSIRRKRPDR